MSDPQVLAEILPTVIAHIQGAPMAHAINSPYPTEITSGHLEVRNGGGSDQRLGPDGWTVRDDNGDRPVDPDRAEHEINPDGWHTSVGVKASNCPFCNEGGSDWNGAGR